MRRKRFLAMVLSTVMILSLLPTNFVFAAELAQAELAKSQDGTFLLYTSDDLKAFADYVNGGEYDADAILMSNITYEGASSIGTADIVRKDYDEGYTVSNINGYSGVFDGNGYTLTMPTNMYLFGAIDGATVKHLTVSGGNKAIAAYMASGTMLLCNNKSTISGWAYCGGIVDIVGAESSTYTSDAASVIRGCTNYGNLNVNWNAGGIVGAARGKNVLIDSCANYGDFNLGTGRYVGGIAGKLTDEAMVRYCFDSSKRTRVFSGDYGIAYLSNSTISNSFHLNGETQTGATKVSGLTNDVLSVLNQNPDGIMWSADGILPIKFVITFDANGGTVDTESATTGIDGKLSSLPTPTYEGYIFDSWFDAAAGGNEITTNTVFTKDTTIYAQWGVTPGVMEKNGAYKVIHYKETADGSYTEVMEDTQFPIYAKIGTTVNAEAKTYEGYTLNSEKTVASTSLAEPKVEDGELVITTLAFYYDLNEYTITFDTDGGSEVEAITQKYTMAVTAPEAPTKKGYNFSGWDKEIPSTMPAENIKITAKWTEKKTISVDNSVQSFTYDGEEQKFAITGDVTDGFTVSYQQNGNNVTPENAGTYDVIITRGEDDTYKEYSLEISGGLEINPMPVNITWENAENLVYDGTAKTITAVIANLVSGDSAELTTDGTTTATDKGEYKATVTAVDNKNYTVDGGENLTKEWTISKTTNEITSLEIIGWTYGDAPNEPTASASYGTPEFTYSDSLDGEYTETVPTSAGTYYVKAAVKGTINYAETSKTEEFVISEKELNADNITAIDDVIYIGEEIKPIIEVKDGETALVLETDYEISYQDNTNAGKAKVVVTFKGNYKGTAEKEFTILSKVINTEIPLTAPVANAAPQTTLETNEYTAAVVWSPEVTDKFAYSTAYTATITITPKANYTVTGISENSYTAYGAETVTNEADSATVTVTYAETGRRPSSGGGVSRYTVKFETNGGSTIANKTVTRNSRLAEPTAPTKDGYSFIGWFTDKELTTAYDFDSKVTKGFTLYAKWEKHDDEKPVDEKPVTPEWENPFTDVKADDWYYEDVEYAVENGLFNGTTDTTFAPNGIITRAMMVTVLYRAEGEPTVTGTATFEDVDTNAYYAKAVVWGQQNGIIKGYSETEFAPDQNITREQIAAIMHRYAQYKGYDVSVGENTNILSYSDYDSISDYAIASMQYAVGSGLMKGKTASTLNPLDNATRAEIAAILHRFIEANK